MDYTLDYLKRVLAGVATALIEAKDLLTHIDNLSGDGDLGISMEKAAYSTLRELEREAADGIAGLLSRCAVSINTDAPSTMGTLSSFSIMEAAKLMKGKDTFGGSDLVEIPQKMVEVIMIRGRAQLGDKTVLDALIPYAQALRAHYGECGDISKAAVLAAQEAERAANATKGCIAKIGRAKWIAERSRSCPDGGAVVCAIVANAIVGRRIEVTVEGRPAAPPQS